MSFVEILIINLNIYSNYEKQQCLMKSNADVLSISFWGIGVKYEIFLSKQEVKKYSSCQVRGVLIKGCPRISFPNFVLVTEMLT
jgi:hypothetical protein